MEPIKNYPVDYSKLKTIIRKSLDYGKRNDFNVNFPILTEELLKAEIGLTPVFNVDKSTPVRPINIPELSAFFQGDNIVWMTQSKQYVPILFIKSDAIDEKAEQLLEDMKTHLIDDPSIDKVNTIAELIGKYPCYTAIVVSYESLDRKNFGKINTEIMIKANTVTIQQDRKTFDTD